MKIGDKKRTFKNISGVNPELNLHCACRSVKGLIARIEERTIKKPLTKKSPMKGDIGDLKLYYQEITLKTLYNFNKSK